MKRTVLAVTLEGQLREGDARQGHMPLGTAFQQLATNASREC